MTVSELRDYFNEKFGLNNWPDSYEVDYETYANVCQFVFESSTKHESTVHLAYMGGIVIRVAIGTHYGIMFKNVELILKG